MNFEWDENKARLNQEKHGVSFEEAKTVFDDADALQIFDPTIPSRKIASSCWGMSAVLRILVVCHCYRANDDTIRIISARKATRNECSTYERRK